MVVEECVVEVCVVDGCGACGTGVGDIVAETGAEVPWVNIATKNDEPPGEGGLKQSPYTIWHPVRQSKSVEPH